MPNWCFTAVTVRADDENETKQIYDKLNKWLVEDKDYQSDFGDKWLGNLAVHSGVLDSYDEIDDSPIACRGHIEDMTLDDDSIYIAMCTAWGPMLEPLYRAIEKNFGLDGITITYTAEEPGNHLYITNDDEFVDKYLVEIDEEADDKIKHAFGVADYNADTYSEDELIPILRRAFDIDDNTDMSMDDLLYESDEHDGISINLWEYEDIAETF